MINIDELLKKLKNRNDLKELLGSIAANIARIKELEDSYNEAFKTYLDKIGLFGLGSIFSGLINFFKSLFTLAPKPTKDGALGETDTEQDQALNQPSPESQFLKDLTALFAKISENVAKYQQNLQLINVNLPIIVAAANDIVNSIAKTHGYTVKNPLDTEKSFEIMKNVAKASLTAGATKFQTFKTNFDIMNTLQIYAGIFGFESHDNFSPDAKLDLLGKLFSLASDTNLMHKIRATEIAINENVLLRSTITKDLSSVQTLCEQHNIKYSMPNNPFDMKLKPPMTSRHEEEDWSSRSNIKPTP